ncbi:hypothetical protein OVA14_03435 [Agrococcus sp. SL85]|uniref:hypothetical protein n=1 Tax=Agrococcus sp. SL85 TaxID=2995141 RepID=UPI00226CC857|nr:hypothetical protein [Agrococcus sp. SL85]WAC66835.1 hypothetical protein OVA14_03435 [Agrococcus sp. SL85]
MSTETEVAAASDRRAIAAVGQRIGALLGVGAMLAVTTAAAQLWPGSRWCWMAGYEAGYDGPTGPICSPGPGEAMAWVGALPWVGIALFAVALWLGLRATAGAARRVRAALWTAGTIAVAALLLGAFAGVVVAQGMLGHDGTLRQLIALGVGAIAGAAVGALLGRAMWPRLARQGA